jgi:hypothetical protein
VGLIGSMYRTNLRASTSRIGDNYGVSYSLGDTLERCFDKSELLLSSVTGKPSNPVDVVAGCRSQVAVFPKLEKYNDIALSKDVGWHLTRPISDMVGPLARRRALLPASP